MKTVRKPSSFPKRCSCCGKVIPSRKDWSQLPPAKNGLTAYGMEWRNHGCGGTLAVNEEPTADL